MRRQHALAMGVERFGEVADAGLLFRCGGAGWTKLQGAMPIITSGTAGTPPPWRITL